MINCLLDLLVPHLNSNSIRRCRQCHLIQVWDRASQIKVQWITIRTRVHSLSWQLKIQRNLMTFYRAWWLSQLIRKVEQVFAKSWEVRLEEGSPFLINRTLDLMVKSQTHQWMEWTWNSRGSLTFPKVFLPIGVSSLSKVIIKARLKCNINMAQIKIWWIKSINSCSTLPHSHHNSQASLMCLPLVVKFKTWHSKRNKPRQALAWWSISSQAN